MGIPGFHSWFMSAYGGAYVPLGSVQADHIYVDMNSILHTALRGSTTWTRFHKKLHSRLNNILDVLEPRCSVVLAVDGPAPLAKLLTQRARRTKGGSKSGPKGAAISSNAITPGTMFMADLTLSLSDWIMTKLTSRRWEHLQIELSDATVVGEGECKILGRMARPWQETAADGTHVIVGDDADLVLMACLAQREHVYVASTAKQDGSELHKGMKTFSVDKLHELWSQQLLHHSYKELDMSEQLIMLGLKMDLTLIAVMCKGDDYLPCVGGMPTLPRAWQVYCKRRQQQHTVAESICFIDPATGNPNINLQNLINFIKESGARMKGVPKSQSIPNVSATTATANTHKRFDDSDENDEGSDVDGASIGDETGNDGTMEGEEYGEEETEVEHLTEGALEETLSVSQLVADASAHPGHYVRGLLWILQSYIGGECPDYRYSYDVTAPGAASVLAWAIEQSKSTPIISFSSFGNVQDEARQPLIPIGCALALLPHTSSNLLPLPARELMVPTSPLGDLYEVCEECESLKATARTAGVERAAALTNLQQLQKLLERAEKQGTELDADTAEQLTAAKSRFAVAREANRQASNALAGHLKYAHPYKPFPIDSVATAATQLSPQDLSVTEQWLFRFGQPVVLGTQSRMQNFQHAKPFPQPPTPFENSVPRRSFHSVASVSVIEDAGQVSIEKDTYLGPNIGRVDYLSRTESAPNLQSGSKQGFSNANVPPAKRRGSMSEVNQERQRELVFQSARPMPKPGVRGRFDDVAQVSNAPARRSNSWGERNNGVPVGSSQRETYQHPSTQQTVYAPENIRQQKNRQQWDSQPQANGSQISPRNSRRQEQQYDSQSQNRQSRYSAKGVQPSSQAQRQEGRTAGASRPAGRSPWRRSRSQDADELIPGAADLQKDYLLPGGEHTPPPPPPPRRRGPPPPSALPAGLPPPPIPSAAMLSYAAGSATYSAGSSTLSYTQTAVTITSGQTRTRSPPAIAQSYNASNVPRRPQHIRWP